MATVADIVKRAQAVLDKKARDNALTTFQKTDILAWIADAYWKISRLTRAPRATATIHSVAGQQDYDIPTDSLGYYKGIISVTYADKPLQKGNVLHLKEDFGEEWKAPPSVDGVEIYAQGPSDTKFRLINAPSVANDHIDVEYVQRVTEPTKTDYSDSVPACMEEFIPDIPLYILGRAMEADKQGRGAAMLGEFESRILRTNRLQHREGPVRAREGRGDKLRAYHERFIQTRRRR